MGRRRKTKFSDKKWVAAFFDRCPFCFAALEIHTFSKKHSLFLNQDAVRCIECKQKGHFAIESKSFFGRVVWDNEAQLIANDLHESA